MDEIAIYNTLLCESKALFQKGEFKRAIEAIESAETIDPLNAEFSRIQSSMQRRDYQHALIIAEDMLDKIPSHPRAVFTLAHLHALRGAHEERLDVLKGAIEQVPANLFLRRQSVAAFEDSGEFAGAIEAARTLVKIEASFENMLGLMQLLLRHGFNEDILIMADQAYTLCEENAHKRSEVDLLRGQALKILGQRDAGIAAFRECLKNKPSGGAAWWALADMKDYHFSDADMIAMEKLVLDISLAPEHRVQVGFALAKAYELKGDLSQAMYIYDKANALRGTRGFQVEGFTATINRLTQAWCEKTLEVKASSQSDPVTPIFILGMPRSGSTLVEQILASHSQIEGTMEMMVLPSVKRQAHILCQQNFRQGYLEGVASLSAGELKMLGQSYLEGSALYRKEDKPFVIDKLPNNFEHIGLIHKILPNAYIIDVRRHPMDCGYSLYKQYFKAGADYSYNLEDIGFYYNGYLQLMDHWHAQLPNKVLTVQYETLIQDTDAEIRRILEYLGLEFEQSCLHFYQNKRAVRTSSSEQVRQPIHTKSIGAWVSVNQSLRSLNESLGPTTLKRFSSYLPNDLIRSNE